MSKTKLRQYPPPSRPEKTHRTGRHETISFSKNGVLQSFATLLKLVSSHVDQAIFDEELKASAEDLARHLNRDEQRIKRESEQHFWQARNLLAEVYDHFGDRDKAEVVISDAPGLKEKLAAMTFDRSGGTLLARTQIRHVLFWGQVEYRRHEFEKAATIIKFCEDFVKRLREYELKEELGDWPHWGTRGLIAYCLGRVYRHQNRLDEAAVAFEESIFCYYQRARDKNATMATAYSYYRVAKALALGVGWVKLAQGHFREALRQNLIPASVLLASTKDELNQQRVFLLEATAERALAGRNREILSNIVAKLQTAMGRFHGHPHYTAKAARELCLAHVDLGQFEEAEATLGTFVNAHGGANYACEHETLLSLVMLGRFESTRSAADASAAVEHAARALELSRHTLEKIEAHITLGRAHFAAGHFDMSRDSLLVALDALEATPAGRGSPNASAAACYLHLARAFARLNHAEQANRFLLRWREIEPQVEHEALREFAHQVSKEVGETGGFIIAPTDAFLDYKSRKHQLQRFLTDRAMAGANADDADVSKEIANRLNVSVPGLRRWVTDFEQEVRVGQLLQELCKELANVGEAAVFEFERLLSQHGAYPVCRMVLCGHIDHIYEKVFRLASENGLDAHTVEAIVTDQKANYGLFDDGEYKQAGNRMAEFAEKIKVRK